MTRIFSPSSFDRPSLWGAFILPLSAALLLWGMALPASAQESSFWQMQADGTRGSYISAGGSMNWWQNHNVGLNFTNAAGDTVSRNTRVSYDDGAAQFHFAFGFAPMNKLLRVRYEVEGLYAENDLNIRYQVDGNNILQKAKSDIYGLGINILFDSMPLFRGRLTPYLGGGGVAMAVEIDLPSGLAFPSSVSSEVRMAINESSSALARTFAGDDIEFAYGYSLSAGMRIEISPILALDLGYLFGVLDSFENTGEARYIGKQFQQARANIVLRY